MKKIFLLALVASCAQATETDTPIIQLSTKARVLAGAKAAGLIPLGLLLTGAGIYNVVFSFADAEAPSYDWKLRPMPTPLLPCLLVHGPAGLASLVCAGVSFVSAFKNIKAAIKGTKTHEKCSEEKSDAGRPDDLSSVTGETYNGAI